tara:strand:+ start:442 stop:555 length:114 start_codon:yes stop_codon:yes gene_type:complete
MMYGTKSKKPSKKPNSKTVVMVAVGKMKPKKNYKKKK